jgi:hypothetical protein
MIAKFDIPSEARNLLFCWLPAQKQIPQRLKPLRNDNLEWVRQA